MKYFSGIDIGGSNTTIGIVSSAGQILKKSTIGIGDYVTDPIEKFLDKVCEEISSLSNEAGTIVSGIGVGAPNGNFFKGTMEYAPNMPWKDIHPIAGYIETQLQCQTVLTNDANAAAIGEMRFGVAKAFKDFILITIGTGLGSGIVSSGNVIYGHDGFAGELGHSVVVPGGRDCSCGRKGCLEAYVSIRGLLETYKNYSSDDIKSPKEIANRARLGERAAIETFKKTGEWLGIKLADAATYTSPEAVVFFGGIAQSYDLLFPSIKEALESNVHNLYRDKIQILMSGLPLNDAAILGAAALVM